MARARLLLTELYEKTDPVGRRFLVGKLGSTRIVVEKNRDKKSEKDGDYSIFLEERFPESDPYVFYHPRQKRGAADGDFIDQG